MHRLLILLALILVLFTPLSATDTFAVNSTVDAVDAAPGDGQCATSAGSCTLRAAIQETNTHAGHDHIHLPAGNYLLTLAGEDTLAAVGDLDITDSLSITGALSSTTIIDANRLDRALFVGDTHVSLSNLTIQGGETPQGGSGAQANGGGILNFGTLTIAHSRIVHNHSADFGGAVANNGSLTAIDSQVSDNIAVSGGGIGNATGATFTLTRTVIHDNQAMVGGGIDMDGQGRIHASTIHGNRATAGGGMNIGTTQARLLMSHSTISANIAESATTSGYGGGVLSAGTLQITNSTISGNQATRAGGGIVQSQCQDCPSQLNWTTITANQAATGGGLWIDASVLEAAHTLLANNNGGDCAGPLSSSDYNLIGNVSGCQITGITTHHVEGQAPQLAPLANNGGPTWTHALQPGSPAIGTAGACQGDDQRGHPRPQGPACDIGAYEAEDTVRVYLPLIERP
jgi:CSLREA domain-containing protein